MGGLHRVDVDEGPHRLAVAQLPAPQVARVVHGPDLPGRGVADRDLADDPVDSVEPFVVAGEIPSGEVPVAAGERQPPGLDRAGRAVVGEADGAAVGGRCDHDRERVVERHAADLVGRVTGAPAQLEEAGVGAVEADEVGGQVQRGELVGLEPQLGAGVVGPPHPVAVDGWVGARYRFDGEGQPHRPQVVLVALEGTPERRLGLGVAGDPFAQLVGGQWSVGGQEGGGEVEEAFELVHQRLAMSFSTRSSWALNGSLHSTVRCAWSLSFRCTQSTV